MNSKKLHKDLKCGIIVTDAKVNIYQFGGDNMKGTHIMTDIETLGTKEGATIFQIAAASFDIETGEVKSEIDLKLDIETVDELSVDGSTLLWWLDTDKELLTKLLKEGDLTELEMLTKFNEWVEEQEGSPKLWGNGILFDNQKIKFMLESKGLKYPIFYRNDRDVRTILALASSVSGKTENEIRNSITREDERAHDALDDVRKQIRLVCYCYELIKG